MGFSTNSDSKDWLQAKSAEELEAIERRATEERVAKNKDAFIYVCVDYSKRPDADILDSKIMSSVLRGDFTETDEAFIVDGVSYPKHITVTPATGLTGTVEWAFRDKGQTLMQVTDMMQEEVKKHLSETLNI